MRKSPRMSSKMHKGSGKNSGEMIFLKRNISGGFPENLKLPALMVMKLVKPD